MRYVYDGEDILFEFDGTNTRLARYTHGPGIDEPLMMERDTNGNTTIEATERFFYHTDGLGSITDLTTSTGTVAKSYVYDSFGNIVQQIGTVTNPYTYTGRELDAESGLYYYRARYYDSRVGRFLSEDPIRPLLQSNLYIYTDSVGKVLPNNQFMNLYAYTSNNPINRTDPLGLYWGEDQINWWNYESALPGPYGQPVSEWQNGSPTGWGDPMKYTECAGGGWQTAERIAVGTAAGATAAAIAADYAGIEIGRQGNNIFRILSKRFKWGYRLDKAHHGKPWGHPHWWRW